MMTDRQLTSVRLRRRQRAHRATPAHPVPLLTPEAHAKLAQQVARILQRARAEGSGHVEQNWRET